MQIDQLHEMQLSAADEAQIVDLLAAAFDKISYGGRSYYQQRHHLRLIYREDGMILGHIALALRAIRLGDHLVQTAGLAEVATHPDHRRKGIATALLAETIAAAKRSPAAFCVLFGDEPIYAKSGFVAQQNPVRYTSFVNVQTGEAVTRIKEGLMVMPLRDTAWDPEALVDLVGHAF
jgi:predicted N-acetyltransferase YhbS